MQITIINVKATLAPIDPSNDNDMNQVTQKVQSAFPDFEGWSYNADTDTLYVTRPNPVITASSLGEVSIVDYTVG